MKAFVFFTMASMLFFSGCLPVNQADQQISASASATSSIDIKTPSALITPTEDFLLEKECFDVQEATPKTNSVAGYLVIDSETALQPEEKNIYALNLESYESIPLLDTIKSVAKFQPNTYTISQDRKWFIYFLKDPNTKSTLHLGTIDGRYQESVYWNKDWGNSAIWLNQNQLFIPPDQNRPSALILNPFTGEWKELQSNFPSGLNFTFPYFYYNATLSNAIYVSGDNYILWDARTNTDVWIKSTYGAYLAPKWSPSGDRAAMIVREEDNTTGAIRDELLLVNLQGNETNLTSHLPVYGENDTIKIQAFDWSPDNRHIAFSLEIKKNQNPTVSHSLLVVDTSSSHVVEYCVPIKNNSNIIWSPAGAQLIIEVSNQDNQEGNKVVIVDIMEKWASQIAEDIHPVGWMILP